MTPCIFCVEKHVARAHGYFEEARSGYPGRIGMALGELSLAEDEAREDYPELAQVLREERKRLEVGRQTYSVPWEELLGRIEEMSRTADPSTRKVAPADPATEPAPVPAPAPAPEPLPETSTTAALVRPDLPVVGKPVIRPPNPPQAAVKVQPKAAAVPTIRPPAVKVSKGCTPCEVSKELQASGLADRFRHENIADQEAHLAPRRVVILTTLGDFNPAYSLVTCILDQARALALAGMRVQLFVHKDCNTTDMPPLPELVEVRQVIPRVSLKEDVVNEQAVTDVAGVLQVHLRALGSAAVITHDWVFQSWFVTFAKVMHQFGDRLKDFRFYHVMHSSVPNSPPPLASEIQALRARIPEGHTMIALNRADLPYLAKYYDADPARFVVVPNIRDHRLRLGLSQWGCAVVDRTRLHLAQIAQVYPLSAPRMAAKGLQHVITLFSLLRQEVSGDMRLVVVDAHANGTEGKRMKDAMRAHAARAGLPDDVLHFVSDIVPDRAGPGLPARDVQGLFQLANLFAFPTTAEAGSLVLQEARLAGNLVVLNSSLPCLAEQAGTMHDSLQHPWGSHRESAPKDADLHDLVRQVIDRIEERAWQRQLLRRNSAEELGETLRKVLVVPPLPKHAVMTDEQIAAIKSQRTQHMVANAKRALPPGAKVGQPVQIRRG